MPLLRRHTPQPSTHLHPPCRLQTADSKLRMVTSPWNACDLLSFAPPLLEVLARATGAPVRCGGAGAARLRGLACWVGGRLQRRRAGVRSRGWSLADSRPHHSPPCLPNRLLRSFGIDLRWTKILRSMRVLRVGLLSSELRSLHLR